MDIGFAEKNLNSEGVVLNPVGFRRMYFDATQDSKVTNNSSSSFILKKPIGS